jgi:hypothetical protein
MLQKIILKSQATRAVMVHAKSRDASAAGPLEGARTWSTSRADQTKKDKIQMSNVATAGTERHIFWLVFPLIFCSCFTTQGLAACDKVVRTRGEYALSLGAVSPNLSSHFAQGAVGYWGLGLSIYLNSRVAIEGDGLLPGI